VIPISLDQNCFGLQIELLLRSKIADTDIDRNSSNSKEIAMKRVVVCSELRTAG